MVPVLEGVLGHDGFESGPGARKVDKSAEEVV